MWTGVTRTDYEREWERGMTVPCLSTLHRNMTIGKDNEKDRRKNKERRSNLILEQVHLNLVFAKVEKVREESRVGNTARSF